MTMTGNSTNKDVVGPLVDDSLPPGPPGVVEQVFQAVSNLILPAKKELITQLRAPTPQKVSKLFAISAAGTLGGSVAFPTLDQIVYTAPLSVEAWLHRITLTCPERGPANPILGGGQITNTLNVNNPAAGANFNATLSNTQYATLLQVQYTLTTSATVANRQAGITANAVIFQSPMTQPAGIAATYTFAPGLPVSSGVAAAGSVNTYPIPSGLIIPPGNLVNSNILNIQAGDQISAITIIYAVQNTAGAEMLLIGSTSGEVIASLPETVTTSMVVPNQFVEGRLSAPHLDRGESLCIVGDGLPANNHIRVDLQVVLMTGASEYTPRAMSPSDLTKAGSGKIE